MLSEGLCLGRAVAEATNLEKVPLKMFLLPIETELGGQSSQRQNKQDLLDLWVFLCPPVSGFSDPS